jgi:hypothetical protein
MAVGLYGRKYTSVSTSIFSLAHVTLNVGSPPFLLYFSGSPAPITGKNAGEENVTLLFGATIGFPVLGVTLSAT